MAKVQASMADDSSHRAVRLVAVDLDGTLLRDDGSVSPRVTDTLRAVQEAGIVVLYVSQPVMRAPSPRSPTEPE